jgi:hypothetical protein
VLIDASEDGAGFNPRTLQPLFQCRHGAVSRSTNRDTDLPPDTSLICFRTPEIDDDAASSGLYVFDIQPNQLTPAKTCGETN